MMSDNTAISDSHPCPVCGYDLRGTVKSERCPECGTFHRRLQGAMRESVQETTRTQQNLTYLGGAVTGFVLLSLVAWWFSKAIGAFFLMVATGIFMLAFVGQFCLLVIVVLGSSSQAERQMIFAGGFGLLLAINATLLVLTPTIVVVAMRFFGFMKLAPLTLR